MTIYIRIWSQPKFGVFRRKVIFHIPAAHLKMEVTARGDATLTHFTDLLPHLNTLPSLRVNCRKVRVQSENTIFMLDHNDIAVEILPWTINRIFIRTREYYQPIRRCMDGCAKPVQELYTMMRITCIPGC